MHTCMNIIKKLLTILQDLIRTTSELGARNVAIVSKTNHYLLQASEMCGCYTVMLDMLPYLLSEKRFIDLYSWDGVCFVVPLTQPLSQIHFGSKL